MCHHVPLSGPKLDSPEHAITKHYTDAIMWALDMCFKLWRVFGIILAQLTGVLWKETFQSSLNIYKKWNLTVPNCSNKKNLKYRVIRNDCWGFNNLILQMQPHVISFYGVTSRIRFMFFLFPQVSRNCRYEPEPPLKLSPLTHKQFGMNLIIMLMFVESQSLHI